MQRLVTWTKAEGELVSRWAAGARMSHPSLDVGLRLADRDKRIAAGVLAGGVAYRLFFWHARISTRPE